MEDEVCSSTQVGTTSEIVSKSFFLGAGEGGGQGRGELLSDQRYSNTARELGPLKQLPVRSEEKLDWIAAPMKQSANRASLTFEDRWVLARLG